MLRSRDSPAALSSRHASSVGIHIPGSASGVRRHFLTVRCEYSTRHVFRLDRVHGQSRSKHVLLLFYPSGSLGRISSRHPGRITSCASWG
jgi:hypothetical protein